MANNLRTLRADRGWSQEKAAERLGTTRNQYVKLERGERQLSEKWINRAAAAYLIDPGEVVAEAVISLGIVGQIMGDLSVVIDEPAHLEGLSNAALNIDGDGLGAAFNGWLLSLEGRSGVERSHLGRLCVLKLSQGEIVIGRPIASRLGASLYTIMVPGNASRQDVEVQWAALVRTLVQR